MKFWKLASAATALTLSMSANAATVDIIFAVDSSGSLGFSGWEAEKEYLSTAITAIDAHEDSNTEYRFSLVIYSDVVNTEYRFFDDQSLLAINTKIESLEWLEGTTATQSALTTGLNIFSTDSSEDAYKYLVLMTDGNPSPLSTQNVCGKSTIASDLAAAGIQTTVVGFGSDWDQVNFTCLVDDEATGIISANLGSLDTIDFLVDRVTVSAVPVPAAVWLFGSGLLGLIGVVRRKKA